jgi:hypothetical protein
MRENTQKLQAMIGAGEADALRASVTEAAAELQGLVNALGSDSLRESDLTLTVLKAWSARLDSPARREVPAGLQGVWNGRVGSWDIATRSADGSPRVAVEAKWIGSDKSHALVWDALKIGSALAAGRLAAGFLVVGINDVETQRFGRPQELLRDGSWGVDDLLTEHGQSWRWSSADAKPRPLLVPETLTSEAIADTPVAATDGAWRLVLVGLRAEGRAAFRAPV